MTIHPNFERSFIERSIAERMDDPRHALPVWLSGCGRFGLLEGPATQISISQIAGPSFSSDDVDAMVVEIGAKFA